MKFVQATTLLLLSLTKVFVVAASAEAESIAAEHEQRTCNGYFCDRRLDEIIILETHKSLSISGRVVMSSNQSMDLVQQFEDGIRGFHFDLSNAALTQASDEIANLKSKIVANPNEFVAVVIQDDELSAETSFDATKAMFSELLIKEFDETKPLGDYIEVGQQVLVVTQNPDHASPEDGLYSFDKIFSQNRPEWKDCYNGTPSMDFYSGYETFPCDTVSGTRMNHFCTTDSPEKVSSTVNTMDRIVSSALEFAKQDYASMHLPNIISVDFYEKGEALGAQEILRTLMETSGPPTCSVLQKKKIAVVDENKDEYVVLSDVNRLTTVGRRRAKEGSESTKPPKAPEPTKTPKVATSKTPKRRRAKESSESTKPPKAPEPTKTPKVATSKTPKRRRAKESSESTKPPKAPEPTKTPKVATSKTPKRRRVKEKESGSTAPPKTPEPTKAPKAEASKAPKAPKRRRH